MTQGTYYAISAVIGLSGYAALWWKAGWPVALAVFAIHTSINLTRKGETMEFTKLVLDMLSSRLNDVESNIIASIKGRSR